MLHLDRRRLLQLGAFGAGALAVPGTAAALASARGFTHNVASGEPSQNSVLLWTRYVSPGETKLAAEVSASDSFDKVIAGGEAMASPDRDHSAKVTVSGLEPNLWYYYRFRAANGETSPVGRTRTLPDGPVGRFALGVFSCSNLPFGWFNAYGHAAIRRDLDLMVHLGDYLYEYERGKYADADEALPGRIIDPASEIIHLTDYRLRHASYRADPDLRRLHQNFPMVAMWDDHESANDSYRDGAQNHQPETEGPWEMRKAAAVRAYREWMPVSDAGYTEYRIGDLATLFRPETRLTGRTKQLSMAAALAGKQDIAAALADFRNHQWRDPARTLMGLEQERLLYAGLSKSTAAGTRWQVLGQQVLVGSTSVSPQFAAWVSAGSDPDARQRAALGLAAAKAGLPFNMDAWDGYPAARERLFKAALEANANLVVLSGDSHNAWGFDLDLGGTPAGVEFGGHSVTSPGYEHSFPKVDPNDFAKELVEHNRQLKWANTRDRGYLTVVLTPKRAIGEWLFLDTIRERSTALAGTHRMAVQRGSNRLA